MYVYKCMRACICVLCVAICVYFLCVGVLKCVCYNVQYVCVYIAIYVRMCVVYCSIMFWYVYVQGVYMYGYALCMCAYMCMFMYVCWFMCMFVYVLCMYLYVHICVVCAYMCVYVFIKTMREVIYLSFSCLGLYMANNFCIYMYISNYMCMYVVRMYIVYVLLCVYRYVGLFLLWERGFFAYICSCDACMVYVCMMYVYV